MAETKDCICRSAPNADCPMCQSRGDHFIDKGAEFRARQEDHRARQSRHLWEKGVSIVEIESKEQ